MRRELVEGDYRPLHLLPTQQNQLPILNIVTNTVITEKNLSRDAICDLRYNVSSRLKTVTTHTIVGIV